MEMPLKSWEKVSRVVSEMVNPEGFHRFFVFGVAEAKVFDFSAVFVCLQGPCLEWMWVLVKCLKMRGLWLPCEGLKDLWCSAMVTCCRGDIFLMLMVLRCLK
jgi:hypothetical protein